MRATVRPSLHANQSLHAACKARSSLRLQAAQRWERSSDLGDEDDEGSDLVEEQSRAPPDAAADAHDQFESPVRGACTCAPGGCNRYSSGSIRVCMQRLRRVVDRLGVGVRCAHAQSPLLQVQLPHPLGVQYRTGTSGALQLLGDVCVTPARLRESSDGAAPAAPTAATPEPKVCDTRE
jgi:hypothetical protein